MSEATALPFPALDDVTVTQDGGRCRGCRGRANGRGDLLCPRCWRLVPVSLVALYRLVWRLQHAQLVDAEIQGVLDRVVVREAREADALGIQPRAFRSRASADTPPAVVPVAAAPVVPVPTVPKVKRKRGGSDVEERLLAVLPMREEDAIATAVIAQLSGHPLRATQVWFTHYRDRHPQLRARSVGHGGKVGRWVYWRSDA